MTAPYLGGIQISGMEWLASHSLLVRFRSTYGTTYLYQVYAGRTLLGATHNPASRSIVVNLLPTEYPQAIYLLAVETDQRLTDYGPELPIRPFNRVRLTFTASAWPADAKFIDITAGTVPGGAVDDDNLLERLLYDADREYEVTTDPFGPTGTWNFEVVGRDDTEPDGNAGTPLALSQAILTHPQDVQLDADGHRFSLSVAAGTATASYTLPA